MTNVKLPPGPFRKWMQSLVDENDGEVKPVAELLGTSERTVRRYLSEIPLFVYETTVDKFVSADGKNMIWDLYPHQLEA